MAKYRITMHYDAYADADIEADSEEEAEGLAYDNLGLFNFEGEYNIVFIGEVVAKHERNM